MRFGAAALLLFAFPAAVCGQPTEAVNLTVLLDELREENPELQAARLQAEALAERPAQAAALPDPMVGVFAQPWPVYTARGRQRSQWRLEQTVPFPGKRALRRAIAGLQADESLLAAEDFELELVLAAKRSYYDLYRIRETDRLVGEFQALLRDFEASAASRYEVGAGPLAAIIRAQLERNRLDLQHEELAADREAALLTLARLLNRSDTLALGGPVDAPPLTRMPDPEDLMAYALKNHPEAQTRVRGEERALRQVELARKAFRPDFQVSVTWFDIGDADIPPSADGRDAVGVGLGVRLPVHRSSLRAGLEQARLDRAGAARRTTAFTAGLGAHINGLVARHARLQRQLALYEITLLPQAEAALEAALSAYTNALADFGALLDAERMLFTLQVDQTRTFVASLVIIAELERAVGVRWLHELDV